MAALSTIFAGIGLGLSVIGSVQQAKSEKKAVAAQQASIAEQRKRDAIRAARERAQTAREARIKRAQIMATGYNVGAGVSSGVIGGAQAVTSQAASQTGFIGQVQQTTDRANQFQSNAAGYSSDAATWGAISGVGQKVFDYAGGFSTIFGSNSNKTGTS